MPRDFNGWVKLQRPDTNGRSSYSHIRADTVDAVEDVYSSIHGDTSVVTTSRPYYNQSNRFTVLGNADSVIEKINNPYTRGT